MGSSGYVHPEWGYLAPAPGFLRTLRIVAISTVVGATAGAAVVFSLADRPAAEHSVMVEPSVTPPAAAPATPLIGQPQTPPQASAVDVAAHPATDVGRRQVGTLAAPQSSPGAPVAVATAEPAASAPAPAPASTPSVNEAKSDEPAAAPNQTGSATAQARAAVARPQTRRPANIVTDRRQDFRYWDNYQHYYDYYPRLGYSFEPPSQSPPSTVFRPW